MTDCLAIPMSNIAIRRSFLVTVVNSYTFLSSSLVREVARLGGRVADFVPPVVLDALIERVGPSVAGE